MPAAELNVTVLSAVTIIVPVTFSDPQLPANDIV